MNSVDSHHWTNTCPSSKEASGIVPMERAAASDDLGLLTLNGPLTTSGLGNGAS